MLRVDKFPYSHQQTRGRPNGHLFLRRSRSHDEDRHAAYHYASRRELAYCIALSAVLNFDYLGECSHRGNLCYITPGTSLVNEVPPIPLRASSQPGAPIPPVVLPLHGTVDGRDYLPVASPGSEPGSLARQRWHTAATPLSQLIYIYIRPLKMYIKVRIKRWVGVFSVYYINNRIRYPTTSMRNLIILLMSGYTA